MKSKAMDFLKHIKTLFDAWKIWVYILGTLSAVGIGGYATYEDDPEPATETSVQPVVADHAPIINRAINDYDKRHQKDRH